MEGERRKRKLEEKEEEDESEEQKMEKFFALIKSTKDLLSKDNKKGDQGKKEKGIWNPMFQLEDFIGCARGSGSSGVGEQLIGNGKTNVSAVTVTVTTDHHHHAAAAGPSEKIEKVVITEKDNILQQQEEEEEATAAAAPPIEENEEKEKASYPLDLNLSL